MTVIIVLGLGPVVSLVDRVARSIVYLNHLGYLPGSGRNSGAVFSRIAVAASAEEKPRQGLKEMSKDSSKLSKNTTIESKISKGCRFHLCKKMIREYS